MDVCKLLGDYECSSLLHYQSHRMFVMCPLSVNVLLQYIECRLTLIGLNEHSVGLVM